MRDTARIKKVLDILNRIWKQNPDLRLGQILIGAAQGKGYNSDIFYVEDEDMMQALLHYESSILAPKK